jgi:hypothetical protein
MFYSRKPEAGGHTGRGSIPVSVPPAADSRENVHGYGLSETFEISSLLAMHCPADAMSASVSTYVTHQI